MTEEELAAHEALVLKKPYLAKVESGVRWWEMMRLWYNGAMLSSGLVIVLPDAGIRIFGDPILLFAMAFWAVIINVFYSLGPLLDSYVLIFSEGKVSLESLRLPLWLVGTLFSILIEIFLTGATI